LDGSLGRVQYKLQEVKASLVPCHTVFGYNTWRWLIYFTSSSRQRGLGTGIFTCSLSKTCCRTLPPLDTICTTNLEYLFATNYLAWNTQTRCFCYVQIRRPCCSLEWPWLGWIIRTSYWAGIEERYENIRRTYPWPRNESLSVHSGCSCKALVYQTLFQVILFSMWQIMLITTSTLFLRDELWIVWKYK